MPDEHEERKELISSGTLLPCNHREFRQILRTKSTRHAVPTSDILLRTGQVQYRPKVPTSRPINSGKRYLFDSFSALRKQRKTPNGNRIWTDVVGMHTTSVPIK